MDKLQNEEAAKTGENTPCDKSPLDMAEDYINWGELEKAQIILDAVNEKSGRKFFLQSEIYKQKCWYNEQRKALKAAIKADPDNKEYRQRLEDLKGFSKTPEYKSTIKYSQLGSSSDVCFEGGCECCCACAGEGLCSAICEGCG